LKPVEFWKSPKTGGRYPIVWEVRVPGLGLELRVSTPVEAQELVLMPIAYWEGVIDVSGTRDGKPLRGHGYMELTGYAGALVGLSAEPF
jgi:predicted secreted hydrolase